MSDKRSEFQEWSIPAVRLLRGAVESDDGRAWDLLLANIARLEGYFAPLGLTLVVEESEGLAYLRQMTEDEEPPGGEQLPRLFRRTRLSYGQTLLCVLLRDRFRTFEEENVHDERCVVEEDELFDAWQAMLGNEDEVKQRNEMKRGLKRLGELGLVRRVSEDPTSWAVKRILKARLPAAMLEDLRDRLAAARHHADSTNADSTTVEAETS